ncbi:MAG: hypothetical protein K8I30_15310 [Anaerolineae bacterium]|nr:hypothetical protein [Anaerolineae bacterium]
MSFLITTFEPELAAMLPETAILLGQANLTIHEAVCQVTLLGSRGLAGDYRPKSDIDLSLMVDANLLPATEPERAQWLRAVIDTTLTNWRSPLDVDVAAVFDKGGCCGMRCFNERHWNDAVINRRGEDCFGVYKVQRGFDGYVNQGVRLASMYPMLPIWRRTPAPERS